MIERIDKNDEDNLDTSSRNSDATTVASQSLHHSVLCSTTINFKR